MGEGKTDSGIWKEICEAGGRRAAVDVVEMRNSTEEWITKGGGRDWGTSDRGPYLPWQPSLGLFPVMVLASHSLPSLLLQTAVKEHAQSHKCTHKETSFQPCFVNSGCVYMVPSSVKTNVWI